MSIEFGKMLSFGVDRIFNAGHHRHACVKFNFWRVLKLTIFKKYAKLKLLN